MARTLCPLSADANRDALASARAAARKNPTNLKDFICHKTIPSGVLVGKNDASSGSNILPNVDS
jgi:hypothetical protein